MSEENEKDKLISYSKNLFFKNGFYKITMDEIAKGMRISKKTIYKYFPSKNILVEATISSIQLYIRNKVTKNVANERNAIYKIKGLTKIFAELSLIINKKMIYDLKNHRPDLWEKIDSFRTELISEMWQDIINKGKADNHIVSMPNDIIIAFIISSLRGVINPTLLLKNNYSINEAFEHVFQLIINAILTPQGLEDYKKLERENKNENT